MNKKRKKDIHKKKKKHISYTPGHTLVTKAPDSLKSLQLFLGFHRSQDIRCNTRSMQPMRIKTFQSTPPWVEQKLRLNHFADRNDIWLNWYASQLKIFVKLCHTARSGAFILTPTASLGLASHLETCLVHVPKCSLWLFCVQPKHSKWVPCPEWRSCGVASSASEDHLA